MIPPISSRTPEGVPNRCPLCGTDLRLEPSNPPGDAPCPNCGHLLWFYPQPQAPSTQRAAQRFSLVYAFPVIAIVLLLVLQLQLSWPEYIVLGILAILLFGRRLPDIGRYFGRRLIGKRFRS